MFGRNLKFNAYGAGGWSGGAQCGSVYLKSRITSLPKKLGFNPAATQPVSIQYMLFNGDMYLDENLFMTCIESNITFTYGMNLYFGISTNTGTSNYLSFYVHSDRLFFEIPDFGNFCNKTLNVNLVSYRDSSGRYNTSFKYSITSLVVNLSIHTDFYSETVEEDLSIIIDESCTVNQFGLYKFNLIKPDFNFVVPKTTSIKELNYCYGVLDLSKNDFLALTKSPNLKGTLIKVPASLLDQYKSSAYWSNYASQMVGV